MVTHSRSQDYVIPDGGFAPNVVPEYARVSYYIRSPKRDVLNSLTEWIDSAAVGAAKGTQTRVEKEIVLTSGIVLFL